MNQAITTSFSRPIGEQEFAKIVTIEYELQSSIRICCLKVKLFVRNYCSFPILFICLFQLQILDVGGVSSGESFTLKYHDIDTIEDFLILRQNYDISLQRNWQPGDRFRSIIDDHWWEGQIVFRKPYKRSRPESQFICFVVQ